MAKKVVIIGAGAAGLPVASYLRASRTPEDFEITVLTDRKHIAYSPCAMPFVMSGTIPNFEGIVMRDLEHYRSKSIDLRVETTVESINVEKRTITTEQETIPYDVLVLGTGSNAFVPPIPGTDLDGVFVLKTLRDGIRIAEALKKAKNTVIIGGGAIGLETAHAFRKLGKKTTVVEVLPYILPQILDRDMAEILQRYVEDYGIRVITRTPASSINGKGRVESVTVGEEEIPADLVLISTGVRPRVDLAREAGLQIGETGGIVTDASLRVKKGRSYLPNVYAAGDCTEVIHAVTNRPTLSPLGTTATRQVRVVVQNILGRNAIFGPVSNPNVCVVGDYHVGSVGATSHLAEVNGISTIPSLVEGVTSARYFPEGGKIYLKLISDRTTRIIGGQIISFGGGVKERVDALSMAIHQKLYAYELANLETCYAPPVSPLVDIINTAGWNLVNYVLHRAEGKK